MTVHIGEWNNHELKPMCRIVESSSSMTSDSYESVSLMADCVECVRDWLRERCTICDSTGIILSGCHDDACCGSSPCVACDYEAAEGMIDSRRPSNRE